MGNGHDETPFERESVKLKTQNYGSFLESAHEPTNKHAEIFDAAAATADAVALDSCPERSVLH